MNIKNYTSGVPVERTVASIESKLAAAGASGIMKLYDQHKQISALIFHYEIPKRVSIKVPANVEACFQAMLKEHRLRVRRMHHSTEQNLRAQASRTAWKLVEDWIHCQISMIQMQQAEFLEVFMPYIWDGEQTAYEQLKGGGFKALPPAA